MEKLERQLAFTPEIYAFDRRFPLNILEPVLGDEIDCFQLPFPGLSSNPIDKNELCGYLMHRTIHIMNLNL